MRRLAQKGVVKCELAGELPIEDTPSSKLCKGSALSRRCMAFSAAWTLCIAAACSSPPTLASGFGGASGGGPIPTESGGGAGVAGIENSQGGGGVAPKKNIIPVETAGAPGDAGADTTCGSVEVDARVETTETVVEIPGNVLFVFDQSSSMKEAWNDTPKWQAANDALVAAFTPIQDKLSAGVILYPCPATAGIGIIGRGRNDPRSGSCPEVAPISSPPQMPIQKGDAFLNRWRSYWARGEVVLQTGTPTELALQQAEGALATPPAGNTAVVLMTDGQPNCGSNEAAVVARLLQKNIKTFVVGLPGAQDGTNVLDAIAKAGGTAPDGCISNCYLSPANPTDLQAALANIASTTVTKTTVRAIQDCKFALQPPAAADATAVHLIATDAADGKLYEVPRTPGNGWTLSADNKTATLEGPLCEDAKAGVFSNFSFQYGCVSAPPLPVR